MTLTLSRMAEAWGPWQAAVCHGGGGSKSSSSNTQNTTQADERVSATDSAIAIGASSTPRFLSEGAIMVESGGNFEMVDPGAVALATDAMRTYSEGAGAVFESYQSIIGKTLGILAEDERRGDQTEGQTLAQDALKLAVPLALIGGAAYIATKGGWK